MKHILSLLLLLCFALSSCVKSAEECFGKGLDYYGSHDYAEAAKWYRKAAKKGLARAQFHLGDCYEFGQGVEQDYAKAANGTSRPLNKGGVMRNSTSEIATSKAKASSRTIPKP